MTQTKRLRTIIISLLAFAVLVVAALFSVSYAKWLGTGTTPEANATGTVGQFYVDYPTTEALDAKTFYLQVPQSDDDAKYYIMDSNGTANEEYKLVVKLEQGQTAKIFKGTTQQTITNKDGITCLTYNNNTVTAKETGIYSLYYMVKDNSNSYNNTKLYATFQKTFDVQSPDLTIKFSDGDVKMKITVNDSVHGSEPFYAYMDCGSDYISGAWPGKVIIGGTTSGGDYLAAETNVLDARAYASDNTNITFTFGRGYGEAQTSYGGVTLHKNFLTKGVGWYDISFNWQSSGYYTVTGADALIDTGSDYSEPGHILATLDGKISDMTAVVRRSSASVSEKNSFTYKNYVCVKRESKDNKTSIAYINFSVEGGADLSGVNITGFNVKRTKTDENGVLVGAKEAEFIYNSPVGKTLAELGGTQKTENDKPYIEGGTYVMLYFGGGSDQYYAMDVEITTDKAAEFVFTATAANTDVRNKYEVGYGEPDGYYLGGKFNGVDMWDPRAAAQATDNNKGVTVPTVKLEYEDVIDGVKTKRSYNAPTAIDVTVTIDLRAQNDRVKLYKLPTDGQRENGKDPTLYFVPHSIHKSYATSAPEGTALFGPNLNTIVLNPGKYEMHFVGNVTYKSDSAYWFDRKDGKLMSGDITAAQKAEKITDIAGEEGNRYVVIDNWNGIIDELYIKRIDDEHSDTIEVVFDANGGTLDGTLTETVTWGNTLDKSGVINKQPSPPIDGMTFEGWYDAKTGGNLYTEDTRITTLDGTLTLYAHYNADGMHAVAFDYNYDNAPEGTSTYIADGGKITRPDDPTRPGDYWSWDGGGMAVNYVFGGWFKDKDCTQFWSFANDTVTEPVTLYAKWHYKHELADNWYAVVNGALVKMEYAGVPSDATYKDEFKVNVDLKQGDEIRFFVDGDVPAYVCENGDVIEKNDGENFGTALTDGWYTLYYKATEDHARGALAAVPMAAAVTVTFDLDGGSMAGGESATQIINSGDKAVRPSDPTKSVVGFNFVIFLGWYEDAAKTTPYDFDKAVDADTTVYAKWSNEANGWSVRVNDEPDLIHLDNVNARADVIAIVGSHDVVGGASATLNAGDRIYLYAGSSTCSKITATADSGAGVVGAGTAVEYLTVTASGDYMLLFAGSDLYIAATVSFDADGGTLTGDASRIVKVGGTIEAPTDPTREYYTFDGWYVEDPDTLWNFDTDTVSEDTKLIAKWTVKDETVTFNFVAGDFVIKDVKIIVMGSAADYDTVAMSGAYPNYTHTVTIDPAKGNIIGVQIQFGESGSTWTAYSVNGYAEYRSGETYTLSYVGWQNPDWTKGIASFSVKVTDSSGNAVAAETRNVVRVKFVGGAATLYVKYDSSVADAKKGIHYFDCSAPSSGPTHIDNVLTINDTDDSCSFILLKQLDWSGGDSAQSNDVKCTYAEGSSGTYTIYAKSTGVIATVEAVGATLSGLGVVSA